MFPFLLECALSRLHILWISVFCSTISSISMLRVPLLAVLTKMTKPVVFVVMSLWETSERSLIAEYHQDIYFSDNFCHQVTTSSFSGRFVSICSIMKPFLWLLSTVSAVADVEYQHLLQNVSSGTFQIFCVRWFDPVSQHSKKELWLLQSSNDQMNAILFNRHQKDAEKTSIFSSNIVEDRVSA